MNVSSFKKLPLMGILRGANKNIVEELVEVLIFSGLKTLEITMNSPSASQLIRAAKKAAGRRLTIGAGTVLTKEDLHVALDSGASFIVSPVLVEDIVSYCVKNKIAVFPGAFSPQEIYKAWVSGATMVKVFPAKFFGPDYFKTIKGPLNNIELLACGGVNKHNIRNFLSSGASALAFGASVFRKEWLNTEMLPRIGEIVKILVDEVKLSIKINVE